jgi:hypothetical protein
MQPHQAADPMGSKMDILNEKIHSVRLKDSTYWAK